MKVMACGRRWGKSAVGLLMAVGGHGAYRTQFKGAVQGAKVWWVAPSHPIAAEMWRDLKRSLRDAWSDKDEVQRRIELPTGGSVTVRSAVDPDSLVAVGLDGLVIDEAARCPAAVWDTLRPTLADRQGWCAFLSTPKGLNWFHALYDHAGAAAGWQRWRRPSSDNPLMTPEELAKAKDDAPRLYAQEYEASFEALEGAVWPPSYFPPSIFVPDAGWPREWRCCALALDPALGQGERGHATASGAVRAGCYAAFTFVGVDVSGTLWCDAWLSQQWDAQQLVTKGLELLAATGAQALAVETNAGQQYLAELFQQEARKRNIVLPLYGITNLEAKDIRVQAKLTPFLAQGRMRFRDSPGARLLVAQLREFPVSEYKDGPDSLQMAVVLVDWLLGHRPAGVQPRAVR
jgi:hypothetical protein